MGVCKLLKAAAAKMFMRAINWNACMGVISTQIFVHLIFLVHLYYATCSLNLVNLTQGHVYQGAFTLAWS